MKKLCLICSLVVIFSVIAFDKAHAETHPYQVAFLNPFQLVNERHSIKGYRLNFILGVNQDVYGFDMGCLNIADGEQRGIQVGFFNSSFKSKGVQLGLFNRTEYLEGIQIGVLNIHREAKTFKILPGINFSF